MNSMKTIFEYDDFKKFLNDFYVFNKSRNKKFSFRNFSRLAEFKTPGILKRVISGERKLTNEGVEKFSKALKLNKEESLFFKNLVLFNQASNLSEKRLYSIEISKSKSFRELNPLNEAQMKYLTKWHYAAIREMVGLPDFREDAEWISKKLKPNLSSPQVRIALEELIKLGLLTRDNHGKLIQERKNVGAFNPFISSFLAQYHKEMMAKAVESIDLIAREKRQIDGTTFKVSVGEMKKIKEMIESFRDQVRDEAAQSIRPTMVCQLNLQFFPLADIEDREDK